MERKKQRKTNRVVKGRTERTSHHFASRLIPSHRVSSHPISSHLIPSHVISSQQNGSTYEVAEFLGLSNHAHGNQTTAPTSTKNKHASANQTRYHDNQRSPYTQEHTTSKHTCCASRVQQKQSDQNVPLPRTRIPKGANNTLELLNHRPYRREKKTRRGGC